MRRRLKITCLASVLLLAGCTMGPDFERPDRHSPHSWFDPAPSEVPEKPHSVAVAEPIDPNWWSAFNDPELTALEKRVAAANLDVQAALSRLAQSRAQRAIAASDELPKLNGDASYTREKPSTNGELSILGGGGGGGAATAEASSPAGAANPGESFKPFNVWQAGFDASWELDLWGKVRRQIEAADATVEAMSEAARGTLISMLAEVARDYLQLRGVEAELDIARANLATARESLRLTRVRAEGGLTTELDVANAASQVAVTKASIPQLEQQRSQLINELSFLLGEEPGALSAELSSSIAAPPLPPLVPIGLPSELAERRPDIRQAEAELHAQTAQIGVAEANFYPSVTINGSIDLQAVKFSDLGSWASRTYTFGPSLSLPIFDGGRLSGNLELTKAEQQGAAIAYRRAVLNAWQEVANALTAYQGEQQRQEELAEAVQHNRRALDLARQQYTRGLVDFLQVLIAQQQLLATEQQNAISIATVSTNLVTLYKALGGGWENTLPRTASGAQTP